MNTNLQQYKSCSFDVFDTVLVRDVTAPEHIFALVGRDLSERGIARIGPGAFLNARMMAERTARQNSQYDEVTHEEIYGELAFLLDWPAELAAAAMTFEREAELKSLRVNPRMLERIKTTREKYGRVLYISDMYLPEEFIAKILKDGGLLLPGDKLYVSSRHRVQKVSGKLFQLVLDKEGLKPAELCHIGDSIPADVEAPRRMGITVEPYLEAVPTKWERRWNERFMKNSATGRDIGGLSRLARLQAEATSEEERALGSVAAGVAAPFLTQYCCWLLQQAGHRGWTDLYFISRDSEVLLEITKRLQAQLGSQQPRLRYLYGSREAWYAAKVPSLNLETWRFLCRRVCSHAVAVKDFLKVVGLAKNQNAVNLAEQLGLSKIHTREKKETLFLKVIGRPEFKAEADAFFKQKRNELCNYLIQEGLNRGKSCVLVDTGWTGTWTDGVGDLLEAEGFQRPATAVMGTLDIGLTLNAQPDSFIFDAKKGAGPYKSLTWLYRPVEMFTVAEHGRTIGYSSKEGRWTPILTEDKFDGFSISQLKLFRKSVYGFVDLFGERFRSGLWDAALKMDSLDCMRQFWLCPAREDASPFLNYAFGLGYDKTADQMMIRSFGWRDVGRVFRGRVFCDHEFWLAASRLHSRPAVLFFMQVASKARRVGLALVGLASGKRTVQNLCHSVRARFKVAFLSYLG